MNFAVIGCGTIAQIMHIPNLIELPEADLIALCDPSENIIKTVSDCYNVSAEYQYQDPETLLEECAGKLDGVIITTPMQTHADIVNRALNMDVNTFVEKPLAVTPQDANQMVRTAADSDAIAMVGYNRRFEPAYDRFIQEIEDIDNVDNVTAHAVDADFTKSLPEIYDVVQPDLSEQFISESNQRRAKQCVEAIGNEEFAEAYDFHLEHICHELNILRDLFGEVDSIEYVNFVRDAAFGTAALSYENGEQVLVQSGKSDRHFHEEFIRIDSPDGVIELNFDHPFIKYNSATVSIRSGKPETTDCRYQPTREESFKRELEHFLDCINGETTVRTTFNNARDDVELISSLFEMYQQ